MRSFEKSNALLERELKVAPLGAQTFSKSYRYFIPGESPLYIDHANGSKLYDVDGNEFIDYVCALGPITLGYNYVVVNNAVISGVYALHLRKLQKSIVEDRMWLKEAPKQEDVRLNPPKDNYKNY